MNKVHINKRLLTFLILGLIFSYIQGGFVINGFTLSILLVFILVIASHIINYFSLECTVQIHEKIYFSGDDILVNLNLRNKGILLIPYVTIKSYVIKGLIDNYQGEVTSLSINDNKALPYKIRLNTRGIYNFTDFEFFITDIFSLFTIKKTIKAQTDMKVYPRIYKLTQKGFMGENSFNKIKECKNFTEDMHSVKDIRKYRDGDSLKRINWKISAKQGELMVKTYDKKGGEDMNIFLDMNENNYEFDSKGIIEEKLVDFTVSLLKNGYENQIEYCLYLNNEEQFIIPRPTSRVLQEVSNYFVYHKSNGKSSLNQFMNYIIDERFYGKVVMLIVAEIDVNLIESITKLKKITDHIYVYYLFCPKGLEKKLRNLEINYFNIDSLIFEENLIEQKG